MNVSQAIAVLEFEWSLGGYLGQLRTGSFDPEGHARLRDLLNRIQVQKGNEINRRLVALTWMIPLFMFWQQDRVLEEGGSLPEYQSAIAEIEECIQRLLGTP